MTDISNIYGQWVHSREEDNGPNKVYRPLDFPLPPSRGRDGLSFAADGSFKRVGIGPTDVSQVSTGSWQLVDQGAQIIRVINQDAVNEFQIIALEPDRLMISQRS